MAQMAAGAAEDAVTGMIAQGGTNAGSSTPQKQKWGSWIRKQQPSGESKPGPKQTWGEWVTGKPARSVAAVAAKDGAQAVFAAAVAELLQMPSVRLLCAVDVQAVYAHFAAGE